MFFLPRIFFSAFAFLDSEALLSHLATLFLPPKMCAFFFFAHLSKLLTGPNASSFFLFFSTAAGPGGVKQVFAFPGKFEAPFSSYDIFWFPQKIPLALTPKTVSWLKMLHSFLRPIPQQ